VHPLDIIHLTERRLGELREAADHRRLLRVIRRAGRTTTD